MTTRRTPLPGVGVQYDLSTRDGRHISVVAHQDGRRFLGFYRPDDPDACQATIPLDPDEAGALAELISPEAAASTTVQHGDIELDLVSERITVGPQSPYRGRLLADTRARRRTGASVVAVLRRTGAVPSPRPDFRLEAGDVLLVVGTRQGVDAAAELIAGTLGADEDEA
ncbi:TrkA C-terminal domain-containing protein [Streptomyces chumphonensis]|uniref:Cation:proton antiporter regulatory subunit n=1 Tax=Streptomyces chumphonensis TaxID=1214925 RepID=A0A927EXY5_9ACTN|nr:cation:proton antiporter regulatory subunit [Streptomyces chumphonensis]MBD3931706.1 cation:proton antiporter regulatory subunit [Streptomyces chumphonensis]